jgi:hypothetical protein
MNTRDISLRTQALAILALVAVFAAGVVCGIVIDRTLLLAHHGHGPPLPMRVPLPPGMPPPPPGMLPPGIPPPAQPIFAELDLSPEQRSQIEAVFERHRAALDQAHAQVLPRVRAIMEQIDREIDEILTPAQRTRLRELRPRPLPGMPMMVPLPPAHRPPPE